MRCPTLFSNANFVPELFTMSWSGSSSHTNNWSLFWKNLSQNQHTFPHDFVFSIIIIYVHDWHIYHHFPLISRSDTSLLPVMPTKSGVSCRIHFVSFAVPLYESKCARGNIPFRKVMPWKKERARLLSSVEDILHKSLSMPLGSLQQKQYPCYLSSHTKKILKYDVKINVIVFSVQESI